LRSLTNVLGKKAWRTDDIRINKAVKFNSTERITHALDYNRYPGRALAPWLHWSHWGQLDPSPAGHCDHRADY
jgi:hypothetical protein